MSDATDRGASGQVAIVGLALRFPGAINPAQFWSNLRQGVESITLFTDAELEAAGELPENLALPNYVKAARTIGGVDLFDAPFFACSPREAEIMDPQHRLFLQCAWEALENAGFDAGRFPGLIGVYAGARLNSYLWNVYSNPDVVRMVGDLQAQIGSDKDYVATRIAYKLDLGGPAVTVQTACSTALVALHLACQGLISGDCDLALAGGVAIKSPEDRGYLLLGGRSLLSRRPLPRLRCQGAGHRLRQWLGDGGAATARGRAGGRRHHPRRHPRLGDQQRRRAQGGLPRSRRRRGRRG